MIAAYLRVSTKDQNNALQRAEIMKWLKSNGHNLSEVIWYADTGSGADSSRPEFEKLLKTVFAGTVKTVVVYKLDRLSRDINTGVSLLFEWIDKGIRLVSVTQQMDFSGSTGKLMGSLLMALADIEREYILERQADGIAVAKKNGVYKGGKKGVLWRYRKPAGYNAEVDIIHEAAKLRTVGNNYAHICRHLDIAHPTLKKYLSVAAGEGLISADRI